MEENNNNKEVLETLKKIEISIAVMYEKLNQMSLRLDNANNEFKELKDDLDKRCDQVEHKVQLHERIVGAVVIASSIIVALVKFGKL